MSVAHNPLFSFKTNAIKVSIVLPFKNSAPYLKECIDSIRVQNHTDWQLIAVDDNSLDASKAIIESYQDPGLIRQKKLDVVLENISILPPEGICILSIYPRKKERNALKGFIGVHGYNTGENAHFFLGIKDRNKRPSQ